MEGDCYLSRKYNYAKNYFDNKDKGIWTRRNGDAPVNQYTFGTEDNLPKKPKPIKITTPKPRSQLDILLGINK